MERKPFNTKWEIMLHDAIRQFVSDWPGDSNLVGTPDRVLKAYEEMISGYSEDPKQYLSKTFEAGEYDEMIHVEDIPFTSTCAHHLMPFIGKIHFSYIPAQMTDRKIGPGGGRLMCSGVVGLSKIPRFIGVYTRRLQVQERLTQQIADCFQNTVVPAGCGVHVRAYHTCMQARGVRIHDSITTTTALRGNFKENPTVRAEFLAAIRSARPIL